MTVYLERFRTTYKARNYWEIKPQVWGGGRYMSNRTLDYPYNMNQHAFDNSWVVQKLFGGGGSLVTLCMIELWGLNML